MAQMEEMLDVYQRPDVLACPLVCMDETSKQLIGETQMSLPALLNDTANLFMFFAPLAGWRHIQVTEHRTHTDWAHAMRDLVEVSFPTARTIRLVCDTLNTHTAGSLYEVFPPEEARRILDRLDLHHTPKHGRWFNMAEIELSVLGWQCLDRRTLDVATLCREFAAWEPPRNSAALTGDQPHGPSA